MIFSNTTNYGKCGNIAIIPIMNYHVNNEYEVAY